MPFPVLDRIKGSLFKYVPQVYLQRGFYKTISYLSRNRAFNYLNYRCALERTKELDNRAPGSLVVESANFCNAKCVMCTLSIMKRPKGFMEPGLFEKIIRDAKGCGVGQINLQYIGEPLMDERFFERVRLIKKYGLKVMFHTNGSLLDEEKARQIIETGVDIVGISIDALSKETFEKVRRGLPFDKVVNNVINLVEMRKKKKAFFPIVKVNFVILDENIHEVRGFYNFWHEKVDHVNLTFAHNWGGQFDVSDYLSLHTSKDIPFLNPCNMLWKEMVVFYDGRVPLCCVDYEGCTMMGDLKTQGIMEVWQGEKFQEYRKGHIGNRRGSLPLCKNCPKYSFWF